MSAAILVLKLLGALISFLAPLYKNNKEYKKLRQQVANATLAQQGKDVQNAVELGNSMEEQKSELLEKSEEDRNEL